MNSKNWFDTEFYHVLYKDRDEHEAICFMNNLLTYLKLPKQSKILDLACGKGRYAIYLNTLGYDVVGVDSSANNIAYAKKHENAMLHFLEHDMRTPLNLKFDAVFNLFTSFGYFSNDEDNEGVIKNILSSLKEGGVGIIDFMNVDYVIANLVPKETKTVDGITFRLNRYIKGDMLFKSIRFEYTGREYEFLEQVKLLTLDRFKTFLEGNNASICNVFGDYNLNPFDGKLSKRLIISFK